VRQRRRERSRMMVAIMGFNEGGGRVLSWLFSIVYSVEVLFATSQFGQYILPSPSMVCKRLLIPIEISLALTFMLFQLC